MPIQVTCYLISIIVLSMGALFYYGYTKSDMEEFPLVICFIVAFPFLVIVATVMLPFYLIYWLGKKLGSNNG